MSEQLFKIATDQLKTSVKVLLENRLMLPATAMIYVAIDTMSFLDLPESKIETQRNDFISWVNNYLLCDADLSCTAEDLYSGRCAMLHTYSSESRLTRSGEARTITYTGPKRASDMFNASLEITGHDNRVVAVSVPQLGLALCRAIDRFWADIKDDDERLALAKNRLQKFYVNVEQAERETYGEGGSIGC